MYGGAQKECLNLVVDRDISKWKWMNIDCVITEGRIRMQSERTWTDLTFGFIFLGCLAIVALIRGQFRLKLGHKGTLLV